MGDEQYASLYLQGIEYFNRGEYFDSHELWEELWIDETGLDRRFYQGLIQVAVALFHLENGNVVGSRKLMDSSAAYLQAYRPQHRGLDIDRFLDNVRSCFQENLAARSEREGDLVQRPAIRLQPPPCPW
jgi:predicted metal-dependent hydrolase